MLMPTLLIQLNQSSILQPRQMAYQSLQQIFDRLSVRSVLKGSTSSIFGVLATFLLIFFVLLIYIPPTISYFQGTYFQSEFQFTGSYNDNIYSDVDFKMALVFKDKTTGQVYNHSQILKIAVAMAQYVNYDSQDVYIESALICQTDYFQNCLNAPVLQSQGCFILPHQILFNILTKYAILSMNLNVLPTENPFDYVEIQHIAASNPNAQLLASFLANNYYQVYYTSKILTESGNTALYVHQAYSSQYTTNNALYSAINLGYQKRTTYMDDSVMPWVNNKTIPTHVWNGLIYGAQLQSSDLLDKSPQTVIVPTQFEIYAYRFYKKLDWLLGIIGGGMFLLFLIFWVPFSYLNRTMNKIQIAERLLLNEKERQQKFKEIEFQNIRISKGFIFTNLLPFQTKEDEIIAASEKELDILKLIKKMKVAIRNLQKTKLLQNFKQKRLEYNLTSLEREKRTETVDEVYEISDESRTKIIENKAKIINVYQNNPTMLSILGEAQKLKDVMFDEQFDKESGHFIEKKKKCCEKFADFLSKIRWFDCFGAKPMFISQPHNTTFCSFFLTLIIITLSVLTFALTIANMNQVQHIVNVDFLEDNQISYSMVTGQSLKIAVCFDNPQYVVLGGAQAANLKFYAYTQSGGKQYFNPVRLFQSDFSYFGYTDSSQIDIDLSYCYKIEDKHQVWMRSPVAPQGQAYFGFELGLPDCLSTASVCAANFNNTVKNFVNFINTNQMYLFLPQNNFVPQKNQLFSQLNQEQQFVNYFSYNSSIFLKETIYRGSAKIIDDSSTAFMRTDPPTIIQSITSDGRGQAPFSRSYIAATPGYQFVIKPHNEQISYILRRYKIDFLFGVFGGVFFFWYCIIHWFAKLYNAFNVRAHLSKALYDEESEDDCFLNKALYVCGTPLCCIPSCCSMKDDITSLKIVDQRMLHELDILSLIKYVDNCYRLSGSFFSSLEAKNLSLIFFREKMDYSKKVEPKVEEEKIQEQNEQFIQFEDLSDEEEVKHPRKGQILNESINKLEYQKSINQKKQEQMARNHDLKREKLDDGIILNKNNNSKYKLFDLFQSPAELTFKGKRQVGSVCGGLLFLLLLLLTLIVAQHEIGLYLTRSDKTVSWQTGVESDAGEQQGISLLVGNNFKFGLVFTSLRQSFAHNVSSYLSAIGISLIKINIQKSNGTITQNQQFIDLIPCPSSYFNGFTSNLIDLDFISDINLGYCIPDGQSLLINGLPQNNYKNYFKVSIHNKIGNSTMNFTLNGTVISESGDQVLKNFFQKYNVVYYFSTPRANSHKRTVEYQLHPLIFDIGNPFPVQHNVSFSKQQMTFDDGIGWSANPQTLITYSYDSFAAQTNDFYDVFGSSPWYNLTFSTTGSLQTYYLTAPKFCESFGILGGIIVFFIFGFGSLAKSFNNYRLLYLTGRQLYVFDKLKYKQQLNERKRQGRKSKEQRQSISKVNNYSQIDILLAYILSFIGGLMNNYNFNQTLRRVTLIQQKVQQDLNLVQFYKRLHTCRDTLNSNIKIGEQINIKLTDIFPKHIYNSNPTPYTHPSLSNYAKKHNLSSFDQMKVFNAQKMHVNLKEVFDDKYLLKTFDIQDQNASIHMSQMRETVGSMASSIDPAQIS